MLMLLIANPPTGYQLGSLWSSVDMCRSYGACASSEASCMMKGGRLGHLEASLPAPHIFIVWDSSKNVGRRCTAVLNCWHPVHRMTPDALFGVSNPGDVSRQR